MLTTALALAVASSGLAEGIPRDGPIETPSGTLRVVEIEGSGTIALQLGDRTLLAEGDYRDVGLITRAGDLVLVYVWYGRSACPGMFMWLHTEATDVRLSDRFGTCSDEVFVREAADGVGVKMTSLFGSADMVEFVYDGQTVQRRTLVE